MRTVCCIVVIGVVLFVGVQDVTAQQNSTAEIVVTGTGEARMVPDRASFIVGVETRSRSAAGASSENGRHHERVLAALRDAGLPSEGITTVGFTVDRDRQEDTRERDRPSEYVASHQIRVDLEDVGQVGPLIDIALNSGATQVSTIRFTSSGVQDARNTALAEAFAYALQDARALANAAGAQLGPLVEISTDRAPSFGGAIALREVVVAGAGGSRIVPPSEQSIRVSITVRWKLLVETDA